MTAANFFQAGMSDHATAFALGGAAIASAAAALFAYALRFLTLPGALCAAVLGGVVLFHGGWNRAMAAAGMFFITAWWSRRCERSGSGGKPVPRNLNQVLANGLVLAALSLLHAFEPRSNAIAAAFLGCVAAVAGDTWASGAALFDDNRPRLITNCEPVPAGTPGAVTRAGIALTALAGLVASAFYFLTSLIFQRQSDSLWVDFALATGAISGGVAGGLLDSYLGAARQAIYRTSEGDLTDRPADDRGASHTYVRGWRWLGNDLVNFANSVTGAVTAASVWFAVEWLGEVRIP